jgi:Lrp/AsnC family transcriptional regulator, leucine-responsive regulatory protein
LAMGVENERLLDSTGWRILEELQGNARLTHKELGRRVNLSSPAAAERMRRMEEAGIITGYRAQIDPKKVGLPLTAFVRIEVPGANHKKVEDLVVELPEVLECHRATGTDCYVMKVVLASMNHLQTLLDKLVVWGSPVTSIVISSPVPGRGIQRGLGPTEDGG